MIRKHLLTFMLLTVIVFATAGVGTAETAGTRHKIGSMVNKEIFINDVFAGQSITLVKENGNYFILRKIFGSGRPVIVTRKYCVVPDSDYQIRFSKVIEERGSASTKRSREEFQLSIDDNNKRRLFLNGLEIVIHDN